MPRMKRDVPIERLAAMTLKQIAKALGCSAQAVRHVEKRAIEKIRVAMIERKVVTEEGRYDRTSL